MIKLDANTVSILVATIGLIGLLVPSLFSNYLLNKADVDITILPENKTASTIILTNDGLAIAKNITLVMKSKNSLFSNIIYEQGTSDILFYPYDRNPIILHLDSPTSVDASFFKIKIPILHPGFGSPINLIVNHKERQDVSPLNKTLDVHPQYEFALTHDQGSTNINSINPLDISLTRVVFYKTYYIPLFIVMGIAVIVFFVIRRQKSFIISLKNELLIIYSNLKSYPHSTDRFDNFLELWATQKHTTKIKKYSNDYMLIDSLYHDLDERNYVISLINVLSNVPYIQNKKFLKSVEHCLKTIDWTKY